MKSLNPKHIVAVLALSITSVSFAKDFTMDEIEDAISYATERGKPLIYVDGHL